MGGAYEKYIDESDSLILPKTTLEGWHPIISDLWDKMKATTAKFNFPSPIIIQVKEKFARLTVYYDIDKSIKDSEDPLVKENLKYCREELDALILEASKLSKVTCEMCGEPGTEVSANKYWIKTLCQFHYLFSPQLLDLKNTTELLNPDSDRATPYTHKFAHRQLSATITELEKKLRLLVDSKEKAPLVPIAYKDLDIQIKPLNEDHTEYSVNYPFFQKEFQISFSEGGRSLSPGARAYILYLLLHEDLTLDAVGQKYNLSRERIRQYVPSASTIKQEIKGIINDYNRNIQRRRIQRRDNTHGINGYNSRDCRCLICKESQNVRRKLKRDSFEIGDHSDMTNITHGISGYCNYRCRCQVCIDAFANHNKTDHRKRQVEKWKSNLQQRIGSDPDSKSHGTSAAAMHTDCQCQKCSYRREVLRKRRHKVNND